MDWNRSAWDNFCCLFAVRLLFLTNIFVFRLFRIIEMKIKWIQSLVAFKNIARALYKLRFRFGKWSLFSLKLETKITSENNIGWSNQQKLEKLMGIASFVKCLWDNFCLESQIALFCRKQNKSHAQSIKHFQLLLYLFVNVLIRISILLNSANSQYSANSK